MIYILYINVNTLSYLILSKVWIRTNMNVNTL